MKIWRSLSRFGRKIRAICTGWWALLSRETYPFTRDRLKICKTCPANKYWICTKCGCVLAAKTRVYTEECPDNKWP